MNASKEQKNADADTTIQRMLWVSLELEIVLLDACSIVGEGRLMLLLPGRTGRGGFDENLLVAFQMF